MKLSNLFTIGMVCCSMAACANKPDLHGIPLVWQPTEPLGMTGPIDIGALTSHSISIPTFTDKRPDAQLVGKNQEEATPRIVTTSSRPSEFITQQFKDLLSRSGADVTDRDADLTLHGDIVSFYVTEKNTYVGDVRVRLSLTDRTGKVLWKGLVGGTAEHFGRSYSAENYYETLSDATVHLTDNLLRDPGFSKALASAGRSRLGMQFSSNRPADAASTRWWTRESRISGAV